MMCSFASIADHIINEAWLFLGLPALIFLGIYFSLESRFFQFRKFRSFLALFTSYLKLNNNSSKGHHPLKMFFAAIGGCVGIGNLVGVCSAVKIGGPGAIFWLWVTSVIGSLVKYAEVCIGIKYRQKKHDGYSGGPFFYLQEAFKSKFFAYLAAIFLCIYGVEVYVFSTIVDTFVINWHVHHGYVISFLLALLIYGVYDGFDRIGKISSIIVPVFISFFLILCFWVIFSHIELIPSVFISIVRSAFAGHAAVGGFLGSTALMAMTQGMSWGCYTEDIGIGYTSVIHSESSEKIPEKQASLTILGMFLDTFIVCTLSLTVVMITDVWQTDLPVALYLQKSFSKVVPHIDLFMPVLFAMLGYSTLIAYFGVGLKNAELVAGKTGKLVYFIYGIAALVIFSYYEPSNAATLMRISGVGLLLLNVFGFYKLRKSVQFGV